MRQFLLTLALLLPLAGTGCFGTFPVTSRLQSATESVSDRYFVKQAVFISMAPAYVGGVLLDLAVFNALERTGDMNVVDEDKEGA